MFNEADIGMTQMALEESNRNGFDRDKNLLVFFSHRPHPDKTASAKEGRPIFVSREYVTIMVPGDKTNVVNRPVSDLDRRRFADKYAAFRSGTQDQQSGTPLDTVPWITREQVEELKFFNVRTLEHLANMPDSNAQRFMGINQLRQKARDQIALAKEQAPALRLQNELRERDERLAVLEKRLAEMATKVDTYEAMKEAQVPAKK